MDYSFFDGLIDGVFVINSDRGIVYCNEAAAKFCDSSVRRLAKGKPIFETIEFSDVNLFTMPNGVMGKEEPAPYVELQFKLKAGKEGKVQIAIQPFTEPSGDKRWVVMLRDVTIEEVLHAKHHKQLKELEDYSKNLEKMVEARTLEVKRANVMLSAIMNSLGQGFLVFDSEGVCSNFYTKACEDILEGSPAQKKIWEVLKVQSKEIETFHMWLKALYAEQLPFESLKELGPTLFNHSQSKHVRLDYFPLRGEDQKISSVVLVATDQTAEFKANLALEKEKKYAKMVIKLITSKKQFSQFLESAKSIISEVKQKALSDHAALDHEYAFRMLHTLEGEAGTYSAAEIWAVSRQAQEVIEPLKRGTAPYSPQMREEFLAALANLNGVYEHFLNENAELFSMIGMGASSTVEVEVETIDKILNFLKAKGVDHTVYTEIEDALLREPISGALRHYQDVAFMVAEKMGKKLKPIKFHGLETKIFLSRYQELFSTFVHAFRNAVDHGIEPSEEREMMGKPAEGDIQVNVEWINNDKRWLRIVIADDGGGISAEKLRAKLRATISDDELSRLKDEEIIQHVFDSGVSTKDAVGEFSGRGIGLNAIKVEALNLGGRSWVESTPGQGSRLIVEVPDLPRVDQQPKAA